MAYPTYEYLQEQFENVADKISEKFATKEEAGGGGGDIPGKDGKSAYEIALDNGFVGSEEEWLESLKGEPGEKGKDGRSIQSITKDDQNNVIVTFTDGSEENIGQLNIDISADFLTSGGFGNLRYYNGKLEYWNKDLQQWIETSVTPDNVYILNMMPQPMRFIMGIYDYHIGHYKLKFVEPKDTVIENQVAVVVESVMIRRKLGSVPNNSDDGELVDIVKRSDFGSYENNWYIDYDFTPEMGEVWYYKAFPCSTTGFYNASPLNETIGIKAKDYELYGMIINQNESNPPSMIKGIEDNAQFRSVYMDYEKDSFYWGDWRYREDVFFMHIRPCMLKYDGTVGYYLNPDDYEFKENGKPSDISNEAYDGNAMMEWRRENWERIWWTLEDNDDGTGTFLVSNKKLDERFHCWSNIDSQNNEIDRFYTPMYPGSLIDGRIRSLSGKTPMSNQTTQAEINYALANNTDSSLVEWFTEVTADIQLINLLLLMIGGSTNTQEVYGTGNVNTYASASNTGIKVSGTMNKKGLFWGDATSKVGVKIFGMEHWWGNQSRRIAGWIGDKNGQKVKMTYGTADGSESEEYNLTGDGYIEISDATLGGTNGGYISKMKVTEYGLLPTYASGSASAYYCDGLNYTDTTVNCYAIVGSYSGGKLLAGALYLDMRNPHSITSAATNASISCKPLANKEV